MYDNDSFSRPRQSWLATLLCLVLVVGGAIGAVVVIGTGSAEAATVGTKRVVVRPVTATGHAARGYRVVTERRSLGCGSPSANAVDDGIAFCGASADYTVACWRAAAHNRVLCLTDPFIRTLHSFPLSRPFPAVRAPKHAAPQALLLDDGGKYLVRDGGAWGSVKQHPTWAGYYYRRNSLTQEVFGPKNTDGINRRHARWFVTTYRHAAERGVRHDIVKAYYVGTAG